MNNKRILIFFGVIVLLIIIIGILLYSWPASEEPDNNLTEINNFEDCVEAGYPVLETFPRQCRTPDNRTFTEEIKENGDNDNGSDKSDLIQVTAPTANQTISSPLTVEGKARGNWFFEASFPVKVYDSNNKLLGTGIAQAEGGEWMTTNFVDFSGVVNFTNPETEQGYVVFEKDNPSGLPQNADELRVSVKFAETEEITVKAFFNNSVKDPENSCNKVFAVNRTVPQTQAVARAALEELLRGTTSEEEAEGYFTNINEGVVIQSLTIENGTAKADFSSKFEEAVGGSCRVSAIRAQITETLKQFSTVQNVIISINGRTEDILQP